MSKLSSIIFLIEWQRLWIKMSCSHTILRCLYRLPYHLLNKEEKLEYEQHFQIVRDLYKSRADFTDEFYNYLSTAQILSDIYLYGYENDRTLRPSKTINSFAIAFLKEYKLRGIDIVRMTEVSKRLVTYWQSNTQLPKDERMVQKQIFSEMLKAIEECKSTNLEQMIKDIKLKNFKKAS